MREKETPLEQYLKAFHPALTEADLEPASTPGYWKIKSGCPGGRNCRHGFRSALGPCHGDSEITIYFSQSKRDRKGRFMRPHRYWEKVVQKA